VEIAEIVQLGTIMEILTEIAGKMAGLRQE
jgi:hypothetical protein